MAGVAGNVAWIESAIQAAKGSAATAALYKNPFVGGSIGPTRQIEHLQETDASRDQGTSYVHQISIEGAPELYVRDTSIPLYSYAALGGKAVAGGGPNYTHTITPATALPYMTFWRSIGPATTLVEEFRDCLVSSLTIRAEAGGPLTATANIVGLQTRQLTVDVTPGLALETAAPYYFNELAVTLGGGATSLCKSFEITIDNNVTTQLTDDFIAYDVVPGRREVSVSFDLIFETLAEYNKFHYGSAAPALPATVSSATYTTQATFTVTKGANNECKFDVPNLLYEEFPIEPDAGGDPIVVSGRGAAQKVTGTPVATYTFKNQVASYPAT